MPPSDASQLKRRLRAEGFEIYRTRDGEVVLAERVRDNLIMDSGVAAVPAGAGGLGIVVVVRAQATHFPGAAVDEVLEHARQLASAFEELGYEAEEPRTRRMTDPGNPERVLDTSYEIPLRCRTSTEDDLISRLKAALGMQRSSSDP
jgi:hypothetical protein